MNEPVVASSYSPAWNVVFARLVRSVLFCSIVVAIWLYVQRKTGVDPGTAALIPCFPGWGIGIGLLFGRWRLGLGLSILILLVLYMYGWGLYFLAATQAWQPSIWTPETNFVHSLWAGTSTAPQVAGIAPSVGII